LKILLLLETAINYRENKYNIYRHLLKPSLHYQIFLATTYEGCRETCRKILVHCWHGRQFSWVHICSKPGKRGPVAFWFIKVLRTFDNRHTISKHYRNPGNLLHAVMPGPGKICNQLLQMYIIFKCLDSTVMPLMS